MIHTMKNLTHLFIIKLLVLFVCNVSFAQDNFNHKSKFYVAADGTIYCHNKNIKITNEGKFFINDHTANIEEINYIRDKLTQDIDTDSGFAQSAKNNCLWYHTIQLGDQPAPAYIQSEVRGALKAMSYKNYQQFPIFTLNSNQSNQFRGLATSRGVWIRDQERINNNYSYLTNKVKNQIYQSSIYNCYHEAAHVALNHSQQHGAKSSYQQEREADELAIKTLTQHKKYAAFVTDNVNAIKFAWQDESNFFAKLKNIYSPDLYSYPTFWTRSRYRKKCIASLSVQDKIPQKSWFIQGIKESTVSLAIAAMQLSASYATYKMGQVVKNRIAPEENKLKQLYSVPFTLAAGALAGKSINFLGCFFDIMHFYYMVGQKNMLPKNQFLKQTKTIYSNAIPPVDKA